MDFIKFWFKGLITNYNTATMKNLNFQFVLFFLFVFQFASGQSLQDKTAPPLVDPETNCSLRYYYYPNIEVYFDTWNSNYIYSQNGQWITAKEIPAGYRGYSLYNKFNVFITDYDDDNITQFIKIHKKKFPYSPNGKHKPVGVISTSR